MFTLNQIPILVKVLADKFKPVMLAAAETVIVMAYFLLIRCIVDSCLLNN